MNAWELLSHLDVWDAHDVEELGDMCRLVAHFEKHADGDMSPRSFWAFVDSLDESDLVAITKGEL